MSLSSAVPVDYALHTEQPVPGSPRRVGVALSSRQKCSPSLIFRINQYTHCGPTGSLFGPRSQASVIDLKADMSHMAPWPTVGASVRRYEHCIVGRQASHQRPLILIFIQTKWSIHSL
jgi:hypothetical protein